MPATEQIWRPGSFTKNFSWGKRSEGLARLHEMINVGFDGKVEDTPREEFRRRVRKLHRPDYIATNFFLFNTVVDNEDLLLADELVFQATTSEHSASFDKLALLAFCLSFAGRWIKARPYQRRPALWATSYVFERVGEGFNWNTRRVNANDIERYLKSDPRYQAKTARKVATNLNYLLQNGRLSEFLEPRVERWWVDALFLALDRTIEDRKLDGVVVREDQYSQSLSRSDFDKLGGPTSLEKSLAEKHLVDLYIACGGRDRFSDNKVKNRTALFLPEVAWLLANDTRPQGAIHPTNPRILKKIPRACAMLARYAGFEILDAEELIDFDAEQFVREKTVAALLRLREKNVAPTMNAEELRKLTRE